MRLFKLNYFLILSLYMLWGCVVNDSSNELTYLPLDDSEYPYANVPRIVIETKYFREVRDNTNDIPALLQIYGKDAPESEIIDLFIRGRGNSSFSMSKYGFKLEFEKKQNLFGMPPNKHWALIANFRDRTHLKNAITYKLAKNLLDDYSPKTQFVELFLNKQYMGLYLLVESVKVDKNRVNINKDTGFLLEKTTTQNDNVFFTTEDNNLFEIKYPKKPTTSQVNLVKGHFNQFESMLKNEVQNVNLDSWIDIDDFIRFYWIQEFSKNYDGRFLRSIFITWEENGLIKMGPVWDFDLAYGEQRTDTSSSRDWIIKSNGWEKWLEKNSKYRESSISYWKKHHTDFQNVTDMIDSIAPLIQKAVENNEKRWPTLNTTDNVYHVNAYHSYDEAIDSLKSWVNQRILWIDRHI